LHLEVVKASLEEAVNWSPEVSFAGLMRAALVGETSAVSAFLDRGVAVNSKDSNGRTPLIEAVFGGHADTVRELLNRGADVNAQDFDGWTALMEASAKARVELVRILLAHGANVGIKNKNGWTALRTTAKCNTDLSRLLRDVGATEQRFAARHSH